MTRRPQERTRRRQLRVGIAARGVVPESIRCRTMPGMDVGPPPAARATEEVAFSSATGRWILLATVLGSGVAGLDATVVNVALPAIGDDLGGGVSGLQWTLNGYLLTLSALILLGGSLGDRYGRRRVFLVGVVWFAIASLLCGLATNVETLIAARALQGVGGALLTPGSLAIIQAGFRPEDRARAVGAWSGLGGIAYAAGPFAGGWLIDVVSWRAIFLLNLPLALVVVLVTLRHVPETADPERVPGLDVAGAVLGIVGLAAGTYALIEGPGRGIDDPTVIATAFVGVAALALFARVEATSPHPMLPLDIFRSRQFSAANAVTVTVYAALGGMLFLFVVQLQIVLGYSPLEAGAAAMPSTLLMLVLSSSAGALAERIGPRLPMTVGPLAVGLAMAMLSRIDAGSDYLTGVLPGVIVFGLALSLMVAPLTATVMAAAPARHAGVASGINNAVARTASLLAVAVLPPLAGLTGDAYTDPAAFTDGYRLAMLIAAGLAAVGGVTAFLTISNRLGGELETPHDHHCALDAPPLRGAPAPGD